MEGRKAGYCIIAVVYIIAGALGVFVYRALPYDVWLRLLIADVVATVIVFLISSILQPSQTRFDLVSRPQAGNHWELRSCGIRQAI